MKHTHDEVLALLSRDGTRLYALLYRLTLRTDVAEDLMQELFCRLADSDGFYRAADRLAYAYRVATNLAFDWRRGKKNTLSVDFIQGEPATKGPSPVDDAQRREELEGVLNALSDLPPMGREILVLRYLEQQSYETIAGQLCKTTHQVRALAHKALVRLRRLLNAEVSVQKKSGGTSRE